MKPIIAHFKVFGCECYMHVLDKYHRKLEPKNKKSIFLASNMESKVYQLYEPKERKVQLSQDVLFQEKPHGVEDEWISTPSRENTIIEEAKLLGTQSSSPSLQ